jgi:hypothetical protein
MGQHCTPASQAAVTWTKRKKSNVTPAPSTCTTLPPGVRGRVTHQLLAPVHDQAVVAPLEEVLRAGVGHQEGDPLVAGPREVRLQDAPAGT